MFQEYFFNEAKEEAGLLINKESEPKAHLELTDYHKKLLTGMMMGDGSLNNRDNGNPHIVWQMTSRRFMEWLNSELGELCTGVKYNTVKAKECAKRIRESDIDENAKPKDYSNVHRSRTVKHHHLLHLDWMEEDGKRFPNWVKNKFCHMIAKIWFVCDGGMRWSRDRPNPHGVLISAINESDKLEWLASFFENTPTKVDNIGDGTLYFYQENSKKFLQWIGDPIPGFEYKWCHSSWEDYQKLKRLSKNHKLSAEEYDEKVESIGGFNIDNWIEGNVEVNIKSGLDSFRT